MHWHTEGCASESSAGGGGGGGGRRPAFFHWMTDEEESDVASASDSDVDLGDFANISLAGGGGAGAGAGGRRGGARPATAPAMSLAKAGEFWATRQVEAERELSDFVASMQLLPDITEEDEMAIDDFFAADPEALAVISPLSSPKIRQGGAAAAGAGDFGGGGSGRSKSR